MSFLNIFGSESTSKTTSTDNKIGASENATATRIDNSAAGTVNVTNDNGMIAQQAITANNSALLATEQFLSDQLTGVFNAVNLSQQGAAAAISAAQSQAAGTVQQDTTTSTDEFIKLVTVVGVIAVAIYAFKAGLFK